MFTNLTKFLDSFLDMGVPGFDCIVKKDGETIYRHSNGYSDLENKITISGKELYNIYSCSKPITCVATLMLYERGLFKLEDKLSKYMPEFETMTVNTEDGIKEAEIPITIKDLFCMTAGICHLIVPEIEKVKAETNGKCPTREIMKAIAKEPLHFECGSQWEYNLCHDVLAGLVEVVSGMKFEDFVKKNIFEPLGMTNSTFLFPENEREKISAHYRFQDGKPTLISKTPIYVLGSQYASGGAGCVSTVDDYIKFLEGLRTGKLLKDETVDLMSTNMLNEKQLSTYVLEKKGYGYGLGVRCPRDEKRTDFGWSGAAGAFCAVDKPHGISVCYLQHMTSSPNIPLRNEIIDYVLEDIKNEA